MRHLRKFWLLPEEERQLQVYVVPLLLGVRFGLYLFPFHKMVRLVNYIGQREGANKVQESQYQEMVARTVQRASRYLFGKNNCLTQALTSQLILKRHGIDAKLRIGVQKNEKGVMQAHAWVENDGSVVIGGGAVDLDRYIPLQ